MFHVIMALVVGLSSPLATLVVEADAWPAPRHTDALLRQPGLNDFLRRMAARDDHQLVVRHAGGEDGVVMAETMRDALVALGIASERIRLEPASAGPGLLILEIVAQERVMP